jgi:branched-chain amino acid transport system substrate-binding protein
MHPERSLMAAVIGLAGCTLTRPEHDSCQSLAQCQAAYGPGYVCAEDGLCDLAEQHPRCTKSFPDDLLQDPSAHTNDVLLASIVGGSSESSRIRENAIRLAIKQANLAGGLDGRMFGIVQCTVELNPIYDDLMVPSDAAVASAEYLTSVLAVAAIIGPSTSDAVEKVFRAVDAANTVVISPSATSPALTALESGVPGKLWRTAPPDSLQGRAIAADMTTPGIGRPTAVEKVAVVHKTGAYGQGLADAFVASFPITATSLVQTFPFSDDTGRDEQISAANAANQFEEILFISPNSSDGVALTQKVASLPGFTERTFVTDTAASTTFVQMANPAAFSTLRGSRPAQRDPDSDPIYGAFLSVYNTEYASDARADSFSAHAYDAAWLVLYAAAWSLLQQGAVTSDGIAEGLRQVSNGLSLEVKASSWPAVVSQFASGVGRRHQRARSVWRARLRSRQRGDVLTDRDLEDRKQPDRARGSVGSVGPFAIRRRYPRSQPGQCNA